MVVSILSTSAGSMGEYVAVGLLTIFVWHTNHVNTFPSLTANTVQWTNKNLQRLTQVGIILQKPMIFVFKFFSTRSTKLFACTQRAHLIE